MIERRQSMGCLSNTELSVILKKRKEAKDTATNNNSEIHVEFSDNHTLLGLLDGDYDGDKITLENVMSLAIKYDVNTIGKRYGSLLHLFVRRNDYLAIYQLADTCKGNNKKLDLNICHENQTPLQCLMNNKSGAFPEAKIAVLLVSLGADWRTIDEEGNSLLHKLLECACDFEIIHELLEKAPDIINLKDKKHGMKAFLCLKNFKYRAIESTNDIRLITLGIKTFSLHGKSSFDKKEYAHAITIYSWAVELFDKNNSHDDWDLLQQILEYRGHAHRMLNDNKSAIENYSMLIEYFPDNANINFIRKLRAKCYKKIDMPDKEKEDYDIILRRAEDKNALLGLAGLYFKQNKIEDAIAHCKKSIELNLTEFSDWSIENKIHHLKSYNLLGLVYFTQALSLINPGERQLKFKKSFENYMMAMKILNECEQQNYKIKTPKISLLDNIKTFLTSDTDLLGIKKPELIDVIEKFSDMEQLELLQDCLIPEKPLGMRMHFPENIIAYALRFFNHNPDNYDFIKCNNSKGSLKRVIGLIQTLKTKLGIWDHSEQPIIDADFSIGLNTIERNNIKTR